MAGVKANNVVPAPGAMVSPQAPGMVPDWTSVPTHVGEVAAPAGPRVRPISQYGTAESIACVFEKKPANQMEAADFEQANASFEELRKVNPANLTPIRPLPPIGEILAVLPGDAIQRLSDGE